MAKKEGCPFMYGESCADCGLLSGLTHQAASGGAKSKEKGDQLAGPYIKRRAFKGYGERIKVDAKRVKCIQLNVVVAEVDRVINEKENKGELY